MPQLIILAGGRGGVGKMAWVQAARLAMAERIQRIEVKPVIWIDELSPEPPQPMVYEDKTDHKTRSWQHNDVTGIYQRRGKR